MYNANRIYQMTFICRHSLMDRQRASTSSYLGSSPVRGASLQGCVVPLNDKTVVADPNTDIVG